jgi:hypothetical protein
MALLHDVLSCLSSVATVEIELIRNHSRRWPTIQHFKRRHLERRLKGRDVVKLSPWQPSEPALWSIADEAVKGDAKDTFGNLRLIVYLGVVGETKQECDTGQCERARSKRS